MNNVTKDTHEGTTITRSIRGAFFALAGALFGALCAADSNVTMTLIANSFATDQMQLVVDEFVRDGGGLRGLVGAMFGVLIGTGLFWLMSSAPGCSRAEPDKYDDWLQDDVPPGQHSNRH